MQIFRNFIAAAAFAGAAMTMVAPATAGDEDHRWGGLYIGASAGWIGSDIDVNWGPGAGIRDFNHSNSGAYFGGHVGIQHQWHHLVIGAELNVGGRGFDNNDSFDTGSPNSGCPNPAFTCQARLDGLMVMIGGRLGWAFNEHWMVYGQGGYANASVETNAFLTATNTLEHTTGRRHDGYYVGGGLEYALNHSWILGIDYKHLELDTQTHTSVPVGFAVKDIDASADIVSARLTWKLGRPEEKHEDSLK